MLLLHGAEDQKFAAIHAQMTARLADARSLAIADAGHAAHLEQPARVADTIERYLSDLGR